MTPYQAILFDLDGTLLDTAPDLIYAVNQVLQQEGLCAVEPALLTGEASNGGSHLLRCALGEEKFNALGPDRLYQAFLACYQANLYQQTDLFAGIASLLARLDDHKIPWGVITNKSEALARTLLHHWPVFARCQILLGGDSLPWKKPHAAPLIHACHTLACAPAQVLYLGDHIRDIQAGQRAAMATAIAGWGYIPSTENPQHWQADFYFEQVQAFSDWLFHPLF